MTHIRYFAVAAAVAIFAGCDVDQTDRLLAPSADMITSADIVTSASNIAKTKTVARGNRVAALVQPAGGSISIDGHTLKVPAGAVSQATWFSMQVVEASVVHVRLKAWRASDGAAVTQFPNVRVELTLDASKLERLDPHGLVIVYLRDDTYYGAKERVPSTVDPNNWTVTGYLSHFSSYALAREFSPAID